MGSTSDPSCPMQEAIDILKGFDIEVDVDIVSLHTGTPTPKNYTILSKNAHLKGYKDYHCWRWWCCTF